MSLRQEPSSGRKKVGSLSKSIPNRKAVRAKKSTNGSNYPTNSKKVENSSYIHAETMLLDLCATTNGAGSPNDPLDDSIRNDDYNNNNDNELYRTILHAILSNVSSDQARQKIIQSASATFTNEYDETFYKLRYSFDGSRNRRHGNHSSHDGGDNESTTTMTTTTNIVDCHDYYGNTPLHLICNNPKIPSHIRLAIMQLLITASNEISYEDLQQGESNKNRFQKRIMNIRDAISAFTLHHVMKLMKERHHQHRTNRSNDWITLDYGTNQAFYQLTIPTTAPIVRERNLNGLTVLHKACQNLCYEHHTINANIIHFLIENYPAALCKVDNIRGNLPIHEACIACSKHHQDYYQKHNVLLEIIVLLVQHWPECCAKQNKDGNTPLHLAVQQYHRQASYDMLTASTTSSDHRPSMHKPNLVDDDEIDNLEGIVDDDEIASDGEDDNDMNLHRQSILNNFEKGQMIDEMEDNMSFSNLSELMSNHEEEDGDNDLKNNKSTSKTSRIDIILQPITSLVSPPPKQGNSMSWPAKKPLPSLITTNKKASSSGNENARRISMGTEKRSEKQLPLPKQPNHVALIPERQASTRDLERDDDDNEDDGKDTVMDNKNNDNQQNASEESKTTSDMNPKQKSIHYQLDVVQYLVDMYPYALRMKNVNGHTPLDIALVSSKMAAMKSSTRKAYEKKDSFLGGNNPIVQFLRESIHHYYPGHNVDDNDDDNVNNKEEAKGNEIPPPPVVPVEVLPEEQYANRYFLIKQLPSSTSTMILHSSSTRIVFSINYDSILKSDDSIEGLQYDADDISDIEDMGSDNHSSNDNANEPNGDNLELNSSDNACSNDTTDEKSVHVPPDEATQGAESHGTGIDSLINTIEQYSKLVDDELLIDANELYASGQFSDIALDMSAGNGSDAGLMSTTTGADGNDQSLSLSKSDSAIHISNDGIDPAMSLSKSDSAIDVSDGVKSPSSQTSPIPYRLESTLKSVDAMRDGTKPKFLSPSSSGKIPISPNLLKKLMSYRNETNENYDDMVPESSSGNMERPAFLLEV